MRIPKTTLDQWRVLQAIVDEGGYAQAAQALHRSQSSISYMVARLQEQLGMDLLVIEGRKARLTQNGKILLAEAVELLSRANSLEQLASNLQQGWEAEVRLAVDVAFPTPLLLQALTQFTRLVSTTRVQLTEVVLSGAEEALLGQQADIVVGTRVPAGYLGNLLLDVEFVAVAHPNHPLHQLQRELLTEDLKRHMQIVVRDSGTVSPRDEGWLGAPERWTVTSMETSVAMVQDGLGFAWLPRHLLQKRLQAGSLWPLPLRQGQVRQVPLYLIFGCTGQIGPATRQLATALEEAVVAQR
ncbi:MAG TPA: LysR family transcriptional regulator [Eoetvoesiella sp.]